ncbi:acyltransferase [Arthrobacter sp. SAFR-014]|uniref:acyltransferase n=1 Tax=unclassified Arthrobacter TaxID=235627 RepID=UPI003F7C918B
MRSLLNAVILRFLIQRKGGDVAARWLGAQVGEGCRILSHLLGSEPWLISIGDRVTVSSGVRILTHDGTGWLHRDSRGRRFRYAKVSIGDDVFVGIGSIIMPGVQIGDRCVIGAGSVVTKSVPSGSVVAGNPARVLTSFDALMNRVSGWPAEDDIFGLSYKDGIQRIAENAFLPEMIIPQAKDSSQGRGKFTPNKDIGGNDGAM